MVELPAEVEISDYDKPGEDVVEYGLYFYDEEGNWIGQTDAGEETSFEYDGTLDHGEGELNEDANWYVYANYTIEGWEISINTFGNLVELK